MQIIATIRPTETRELAVDGEDNAAARAAAEAQVPADWQIISYRTVR